jgi:hypothetical protein
MRSPSVPVSIDGVYVSEGIIIISLNCFIEGNKLTWCNMGETIFLKVNTVTVIANSKRHVTHLIGKLTVAYLVKKFTFHME